MIERIENPRIVGSEEISRLISDGIIPVIQFSEKAYDRKILKNIDSLCINFGESLEVRFYGHYNSDFDASWLEFLPNVANLSIDCMQSIRNEAALEKLENLKKLSFGIYDFEDREFLSRLKLDKVEKLVVGDNHKNCFDLSSLSKCRNLVELFISGHTKGIQSIGALPKLQVLTLGSIPKKQDLGFVNSLANLKRLTILLGGRESISEITNPNIEELEIIRVRGFGELDNIDRFKKLNILEIEDQIRLKRLDFEKSLPSLKYLRIANCKELDTIEGIERLRNIEHIRIYKTNLDLEKFVKQSFPKTLKILAVYTGKSKIDKKLRQTLDEMGFLE